MMKKMFEYENEVIEEELYKFDEEEVDKLMEEKPWRKKYRYLKYILVRTTLRESRSQL